MNRFALLRRPSPLPTARRGYTLVEILVATTLSLLILGAVVQLFAKVGTSINQSRAILESAEALRHAQNLLQADLEGATVTPIPPARTDGNTGYIEIIKGAVVQWQRGPFVPDNGTVWPATTTDGTNRLDTSVGAMGNILMLTTRTKGKPFTGRHLMPRRLPSGAFDPILTDVVVAESDVAEVAYFLRGKNLHRRVLLVAPSLSLCSQPNKALPWVPNGPLGFYADNDISVRWVPRTGLPPIVLPNTLGDLTRRECRFAHPIYGSYDVRSYWPCLGLPTLQECSDVTLEAGRWDLNFFTNAIAPIIDPVNGTHWQNLWARHPDIQALPNPFAVDYWSPEPILNFADSELTKNGTRTSDDLILTNVLSFDIKVWDAGYPILQEVLPSGALGNVLKPGDAGYILPGNSNYRANLPYVVLGFGGYVDLGYYPVYSPVAATAWLHALPCPAPTPNFSGLGNSTSPLAAANPAIPRVYDTWSNTYDNVPFPNTSIRPNDGFDNGGVGIVDNDAERAFPTPYSAPLRGVQVIIRIYEPDSRQIREVTIEQDFLPK